MLSKLLLFLISSLMVTSVLAEDAPSRIGYAFDKKTDELVYTESHYENISAGLVEKSEVIYKDPSSNIIAKKTANFAVDPFMPEFSLVNNKTGHREQTEYIEKKSQEKKYKVLFTKTSKGPVKDKTLALPEKGISDAGFDNFIVEHWDELKAGEVLIREFLIPSQMDFIKFKIYQDSITEIDNEKLRVINIEPKSFLIRAFAGTTKLYYSENKPELKRFDGVSNMRDANGDNYKVVIKYENQIQLVTN
ncbi:MAG: hypothetical protein ACPHLK_09330 [Gammaproteobacteria bacterium]|jgi:hypothetical protein